MDLLLLGLVLALVAIGYGVVTLSRHRSTRRTSDHFVRPNYISKSTEEGERLRLLRAITRDQRDEALPPFKGRQRRQG